MATSGSGSAWVDSTHYIKLVLKWQQLSQDVGANKTRIRLTLQVVTNAYGAMYGSASLPWSINCNTTTNGRWSIQTGANTTRTIGTKDVDITHNANGTKTFSASASVTFNMNFNGWVGSVGVSVSGTLNTIARASKPSIITYPNTTTDIGDIGEAVMIHMNRASSSFTHTVRYSFHGLSGTIATGVGDNTAWTIPTSFNNKVVNGTSASGTVTVDTYNGRTKIGTKSVSFTVHVPASVKPTVSSVSVVDDSGYYSKYGGYVQGKSELRATISAAGAYESTIKSVTSTIKGRSITGTSIGIGTVDASGNTQLKTTVRDSRGRTGSKTTTLNFLAYSAPKFTSVTATRTPTSESSTVRVALKGSTTNLGNRNTNTATVTIERRQHGTSSWTQVDSANRGLSWSYTQDIVGLSPDNAWEIRVTATDQLGVATQTILTVNTAQPILDFRSNGRGLGIGAVADTDDAVRVGWRIACDNLAQLTHGVQGCSMTGYLGSGVNWIEIARSVKAYNDDTSAGNVRISGYLGGYGAGACSPLEVFVPFRDLTNINQCQSLYLNDDTCANDRAKLEVYKDSSGFVHVYVRISGYYNFSLVVTGNQFTCPNLTLTSTPPGTRLGDMFSMSTNLYWNTQGITHGRVMKTIWTGTWKSGSITVPGAQFYNLFVFDVAESDDVLILPRNDSGNAIRGSIVRPYTAGNGAESFYFNGVDVDVSGNTLTMVKAISLSFYIIGNNQAPTTYRQTTPSVNRIRGVL